MPVLREQNVPLIMVGQTFQSVYFLDFSTDATTTIDGIQHAMSEVYPVYILVQTLCVERFYNLYLKLSSYGDRRNKGGIIK